MMVSVGKFGGGKKDETLCKSIYCRHPQHSSNGYIMKTVSTCNISNISGRPFSLAISRGVLSNLDSMLVLAPCLARN